VIYWVFFDGLFPGHLHSTDIAGRLDFHGLSLVLLQQQSKITLFITLPQWQKIVIQAKCA